MYFQFLQLILLPTYMYINVDTRYLFHLIKHISILLMWTKKQNALNRALKGLIFFFENLSNQ